jgi:hypothetical protein
MVLERFLELRRVCGGCHLRQRLDELLLRAAEVAELFDEDVLE